LHRQAIDSVLKVYYHFKREEEDSGPVRSVGKFQQEHTVECVVSDFEKARSSGRLCSIVSYTVAFLCGTATIHPPSCMNVTVDSSFVVRLWT
jgi:hypothetical protein